jgi:hypothetical protein
MESSRKNENVNRRSLDQFLQSVTKYVSKPLGFNKMYQEEQMERVKKRGKSSFKCIELVLIKIQFKFDFSRNRICNKLAITTSFVL